MHVTECVAEESKIEIQDIWGFHFTLSLYYAPSQESMGKSNR